MVITQELRKLYPFAPHYFNTPDGHRMNYLDEGNGDPILCIHGNPTWSFYYRELVNEFRRSHRVIVPDHVGCGLSDKPQNFSYQLADHIRNLENFILHLNLQNITLVVHDWGGPIGIGAALKQKLRISKLVILNTAAFLSKDIPKRIASLRSWIFPNLLIRRANLFCLAATTMTTVKKLRPELKRAYLFPYRNYHDRVAIAGFVKDIPLEHNDPSYQTLSKIEQGLSTLKVPTLFLWGARDFCFNLGFLRKWQKIYPEAHTVIFENAGHYVLEDESEAIVQQIRKFLQ